MDQPYAFIVGVNAPSGTATISLKGMKFVMFQVFPPVFPACTVSEISDTKIAISKTAGQMRFLALVDDPSGVVVLDATEGASCGVNLVSADIAHDGDLPTYCGPGKHVEQPVIG